MTGDRENDSTWGLQNQDREHLSELRSTIRRLARLADSGSAVAAVGEAWDALDRMLDDDVRST